MDGEITFGETEINPLPLTSLLRAYRGVEQLVARRAHNPKVVSSSLAPATKESQRLLAWVFF